MKKSVKKLPKPRSSLYKILEIKAASNASGKHVVKKPKLTLKIIKELLYE